MIVLAIVLAVTAAVTFAYSAVLQQRTARQAPESESLRLSLLFDLLHRRTWLAGMGLVAVAYCLQAVALGLGSVALVEPLVATELVFAVPLAIRGRQGTPGRREWTGTACVVGGVVLFLVASAPAGGHPDPGMTRWLSVLVPSALVVIGCVAAARGPESPRRAMLLAVAAGISFGVLALLTKSVIFLFAHGVGRTFGSWQPYALAVVGIIGFLFAQSAYGAGPLAISLPIIDSLEPVVAVLLATIAFDERLSVGARSLGLEAAGAFAAAVGVFLLGRSPLVLSIYEQTEHQKKRSGIANTNVQNSSR